MKQFIKCGILTCNFYIMTTEKISLPKGMAVHRENGEQEDPIWSYLRVRHGVMVDEPQIKIILQQFIDLRKKIEVVGLDRHPVEFTQELNRLWDQYAPQINKRALDRVFPDITEFYRSKKPRRF